MTTTLIQTTATPRAAAPSRAMHPAAGQPFAYAAPQHGSGLPVAALPFLGRRDDVTGLPPRGAPV